MTEQMTFMSKREYEIYQLRQENAKVDELIEKAIQNKVRIEAILTRHFKVKAYA